ncbi:MAG: hypothetical protein GVY27_02925, partial [Deinococcus-Thermus bacterium]|nr:hypothetical protein [Deinococcota bacterium]
MTRRLPLRSFAAALLMAAVAGPAPAQDAGFDPYGRGVAERRIETERLGPTAWRSVIPLSEIREQPGPIRLEGAEAREDLAFAVSPSARLTGATLRLLHVSSAGLVEDTPHLRITQNGGFVAQLPARREPVATAAEIELDPLATVPGFNRLGLTAIQRYTFGCQDPTAPELWTEIDALRSELDVTYERRPFDGTLADLDLILSPGIGGVDALTILTGTDEPTPAQARWGALAAQSVAHRLGFRIPALRHAVAAPGDGPAVAGSPAGALDPDLLGDGDAVIVGTLAEIGDVVTLAEDDIDTAWLEIGPSPADPTRFVLVATGPTEADVDRAVTALGLMTFPFGDTTHAAIDRIDLPEGFIPAIRPPVEPETVYAFDDFGFDTTTVRGSATARLSVGFDAPADLFVDEEAEAVLALDFAYGAGMRDDSVLNVLVNDTFYRAIPLDQASGALLPGYRVAVPGRAFGPGGNQVRFDVEMVPRESGDCGTGLRLDDRNLVFSLQETSSIAFPPAARFVRLPDFDLLERTGFPYTAPNSESYAVRLTDTGSETLAAAWTFLAKLAQANRSLSVDADFAFGAPTGDRHALVFGPVEAIPGGLRSAAELQLGPPHAVPQGDRAGPARAADDLPGFWSAVAEQLGLRVERPLPELPSTPPTRV